MSEATQEQKAAAVVVRNCCSALSRAVKEASKLGLEIEIEVLPHYQALEGRRVSVPTILSAVKKVEVL